jgi:DNA-directed RNA polymerase specialized sigma24 family protein
MPGESELDRLYDDHAQALFALLRTSSAMDDARAVRQDIFAKLARQPGLLASARDERAFLIRMAHNTAVDLMRRRGTLEKAREQLGAEAVSPFAPARDLDEQAFRTALDSALRELPPSESEANMNGPPAAVASSWAPASRHNTQTQTLIPQRPPRWSRRHSSFSADGSTSL